MDQTVKVNAAGNLDERSWGQWVITRGDLDHVRITDLASGNGLGHTLVGLVEASVEADEKGKTSLLRHVEALVNLVQVISQRLLSEDGLACLEGFGDLLEVHARWGGDDNGVHLGVLEGLLEVGGPVTEHAVGGGLGELLVGVDGPLEVDARKLLDRLNVELASASQTEQGDVVLLGLLGSEALHLSLAQEFGGLLANDSF